MPQRILRDGIVTSSAVNKLSFRGEIFYRRLMSFADDYGRFDGRIEILLGALFALQPDRWGKDTVEAALIECCEVKSTENSQPLITRYEVDGRIYIQINNFGQRTRYQSKYPDPPESVTADFSPPKSAKVRQSPPYTHSITHTNGSLDSEEASETKKAEGTVTKIPRPPKLTDLLADDIDGWPAFCEAWRAAGATAASTSDWNLARSAWRSLSHEQREAARSGITARKGTEDPALTSLPINYIRRAMWERGIRQNGIRKASRVEQIFDELDQERGAR